MATPVPPASHDLDRAFEEHRGAVLAMLRTAFRDLPDHEDLYQEAWLEALEKTRQGATIGDLRALLKVIAWRRARDRVRDLAAVPVDPAGAEFATQVDEGRSPDEILQVSVESAVVRSVVAELEPRRAAAIKMRFELGMESHEIEQALGITRGRLDKLFRTTYRAIEEQLTADSSGETPWTRRQRSLLYACLSGLASPRQREKAQRLVDTDPACRALFLELRATLERVATVLPLPVAERLQHEHAVPVLDQVQHGAAAVRDALAHGAGKAGAHASTLEPTTSGLASVSAAGAAKVVLVCLSLGGGAAVCIELGVVGRDPKPEKPVTYDAGRPPPKEERVAVVQPRPRPQPKPVVRARKASVAPLQRSAAVQPRTNGPAAPSPVPPGSSEFGPGSVGSVPASREPAAAPLDGGGEFTP